MGFFTYDPSFNLKCERCYRPLKPGERYYSLHSIGRWGPSCLPCQEAHTKRTIVAAKESVRRYEELLERIVIEIAKA